MKSRGTSGVAALVAIGAVFVGSTAAAEPVPAGLRVVAHSGQASPIAGWNYGRLQGWAALKGGDIALNATVADTGSGNIEDVIVREGLTRTVIVSAATAKPGGGTWGTVSRGMSGARGNFVLIKTNDNVDTTWYGFDTDTNTARRLYGTNDQYGGKTVATPTPPLINSLGQVLVNPTAGLFALNATGEQKPIVTFLGPISGLPAEWSAPATGLPIAGFLDENGLVTAFVPATRKVNAIDESKTFVMHGAVDGALAELPWVQSTQTGPNTNVDQSIITVGRGGAMVGVKRTEDTTTSTVKEAYHSGDGTTMTQAFDIGTVSSTVTAITLDGVSVMHLGELKAISDSSFAFTSTDGGTHLFVWNAGAAKHLAGPGMNAPGTTATFDSVGRFIVNRRGQLLLAATAGGKSGIWLAEPGAALTLLALSGMDLPLPDGRTVQIQLGLEASLPDDALADDGSIAFVAGIMGASPPQHVALVRGDANPNAGADLELTVRQSRDGAIIFTVKNLGPATANGIALRVTANTTLLKLVVAAPECQVGMSEMNCAVGTVMPQATKEYVLDNPEAGVKLEGTVTGASDSNLANNTVSIVYEPNSSKQNVDDCHATPGRTSTSHTWLAFLGLALAGVARRARRRHQHALLPSESHRPWPEATSAKSSAVPPGGRPPAKPHDRGGSAGSSKP